MRFSDETLMAFADGELGEPIRSQVEQAMRKDPQVAAKVAQHRAMRADIFHAFSPTLEEPPPPHLRKVVPTAKVVHLDTARAAKNVVATPPRRWAWPEWSALGTTLLVGLLAGAIGVRSVQGDTQLASAVAEDGSLTARGALATALTRQLASAALVDSKVRIGVSFVSKEGEYCRSFAMGAMAGLACRNGKQWKIPVLTEATSAEAGSAGVPAAVMQAIDARAVGPSLDARAEQAAAVRGWSR